MSNNQDDSKEQQMDLFTAIVCFMNEVEKIRDIEGSDKKTCVLVLIRKYINDSETYERYAPFIEITIDGIVALTRKKLKLVKKSKNGCLVFIRK